MATDGQRTQAFIDRLADDPEKHALAETVIGMPGGSMAVAYVACMVLDLERKNANLPLAISASVESAVSAAMRSQRVSVGTLVNSVALAVFAAWSMFFGQHQPR